MKLILIVALLATSALALDLSRAPIFKKKISQKNAPSTVGKAVSNIKWTDCDGTGTPYLELTSVTVTGTLEAGKTITVVGKANNKQSFTIAFGDVTAWVSGIKVFSGVEPVDPPQSFNPGPGDLTVNYELPITPPNGNYKVQARLQDKSHKELQCFLVTFTIG